jgi:cyclophilin family peptidyl-prolyl cis-trans isomerase/Skp family chaperone for outer membrane proteins
MAMKKRDMHSPASDIEREDSSLSLHMGGPVMLPLERSESYSSVHDEASEILFRSPRPSKETLHTWSANPQSPGSGSGPTLPLHISSSPPEEPRKWSIFMLGFVALGLVAVYVSHSYVNGAARQVEVLEHYRIDMDNKIKKYEKDIHVLEREISAMDALIQKQQKLDARSYHVQATQQRALNEMNALQKRLKLEAEQAKTLKKEVQEKSKEDIVQKYGSGVHKVEIELVFPDKHRGPKTFVIELAPAEVMPHSVHTFLEMVSTGLLDGCSFILNALHVLKAAPLPYDGTSAAAKAKAFSERGLESVAFKEYNAAYTHKQYTVGFAADGSPSFYINTDDNSEIHVGDPCFGKVIEGFDAIRRLEASPTRNGIWFEKRIGIKKARILKD